MALYSLIVMMCR